MLTSSAMPMISLLPLEFRSATDDLADIVIMCTPRQQRSMETEKLFEQGRFSVQFACDEKYIRDNFFSGSESRPVEAHAGADVVG
jgi:hypothetical protein